MARGKNPVEQAADELYGLPPGDFTRARDERVKALRKDDREAANAVKALRKPTVAAWAVNQLPRRRRKEIDRLLSAGERLRAAQEELLGGGERAAFQQAAGEERELVAELTRAAMELAGEAGERASGLDEKVAATLHAAALDEAVAEQVGAGRLVREQEAIGGFGMAGGGLAPARPAKRAVKRQSGAGKDGPKTGAPPAQARVKERLAAARTDERHARRELEAAEKALRSAEERAQAAEKHAAEAAERAKTTAERLGQARRAEAAARRAHARARRALEAAGG